MHVSVLIIFLYFVVSLKQAKYKFYLSIENSDLYLFQKVLFPHWYYRESNQGISNSDQNTNTYNSPPRSTNGLFTSNNASFSKQLKGEIDTRCIYKRINIYKGS